VQRKGPWGCARYTSSKKRGWGQTLNRRLNHRLLFWRRGTKNRRWRTLEVQHEREKEKKRESLRCTATVCTAEKKRATKNNTIMSFAVMGHLREEKSPGKRGKYFKEEGIGGWTWDATRSKNKRWARTKENERFISYSEEKRVEIKCGAACGEKEIKREMVPLDPRLVQGINRARLPYLKVGRTSIESDVTDAVIPRKKAATAPVTKARRRGKGHEPVV